MTLESKIKRIETEIETLQKVAKEKFINQGRLEIFQLHLSEALDALDSAKCETFPEVDHVTGNTFPVVSE